MIYDLKDILHDQSNIESLLVFAGQCILLHEISSVDINSTFSSRIFSTNDDFDDDYNNSHDDDVLLSNS